MKYLLLVFFIFTSSVWADEGQNVESELVGRWQFYKIHYEGSERPIPNPKLILRYHFFADGTDTLSWERIGEEGYCKRKGSYQFTPGQLVDEVTWVDPKNNRECSSDPDMQVGRKSNSVADIKNGEFNLYLGLGDKSIIYIFRKIDDNEP